MNKLIILLGFGALFLQTSCQSEKHHKQEEETKFLVTSPLAKDTSILDEYVCQIHSIQHIEIRAQERGFLQHSFVDEGQFVKKGQLLFKIMPALYEAEMEIAKAEANYAKIEYLNTKKLADSNVVATNELAMSKAKYDKAKAELKLANVHLQFTEIRAPFDGFVDRFHVRLGSLVDEGELITNLSDNSEMWVYFNVPEAEYLEYETVNTHDSIMTVSLMMANNKLFSEIGRVETIEADFDNETGNIPFRATFPNPTGLLRHGETGNILISVPITGKLLIPQKATFEVLDKKYVYVLDSQNVLHSREITIASEMQHVYAISGGLQKEDRILLEGLRLVRENDSIAVEFVDPAEALSQLALYAE